MKNSFNDRLLLLATAQESMRDVSEKLELWNKSQLSLEKNAFDAMNLSDQVLNMSRTGKKLIAKLQDQCCRTSGKLPENDCADMKAIMLDIKNLFAMMTEASLNANNIAHNLEEEIALQKEIEEGIKNTFGAVSESLDTAAACAEMMFTEF